MKTQPKFTPTILIFHLIFGLNLKGFCGNFESLFFKKNTNQIVFKTENPDSSGSNFKKYKIPKFRIRYGTTPGNVETAPFLRSIYGSQKVKYYNTPYFGDTRFSIDEPDNFLQIQIRKSGNVAYTFLLMKQKFRPDANGFKLEAPTALEFGLAVQREIFGNRWFNLAADFSGSAGVTVADVKFQDRPDLSVEKPWYTLSGYSPVGFGATAIARMDAAFFNRFVLFVAGNLHHYQGTSIKTSLGKQRVKHLGSAEITVGVGLNFGNK